MRRTLYYLVENLLRRLDGRRFDHNGLPLRHPHAVMTRSLTQDEHAEMIEWIDHNVFGPIVMTEYAGGLWDRKSTVLDAHRSLHARNAHLAGSTGSAPFTLKRATEFKAFKAKWG